MAVTFSAAGRFRWWCATELCSRSRCASGRPTVRYSRQHHWHLCQRNCAVLAFGDVVVYNSAGTVANSAKTISGATDTVQGVNVLTYVDETALDSNSRPGVKDEQVLNVANEGAVAMYVHGPCDPATPVRVVHTATGVKYAGQFSGPAISGKTAILANARYLSSVTGSGLAIVELNGPSFTLTADT